MLESFNKPTSDVHFEEVGKILERYLEARKLLM